MELSDNKIIPGGGCSHSFVQPLFSIMNVKYTLEVGKPRSDINLWL